MFEKNILIPKEMSAVCLNQFKSWGLENLFLSKYEENGRMLVSTSDVQCTFKHVDNFVTWVPE